MRVAMHAVGRMKAGPESELCERYCERFRRSGPALGLHFDGVVEIAESRAAEAARRRAEETEKLMAGRDPSAYLLLLDETGTSMKSDALAELLANERDGGRGRFILAIGGPDGHDPTLLAQADKVVAFGRATFPHQIVRILAAEQLYRAATILSGHPYHRA